MIRSSAKDSWWRLAVGSLAAFAVCVALSLSVATTANAAPGSDKTKRKAEKALRGGEYEAAEKLFREVLAKDARDTEARLGLSYTLYKLRNMVDAYDHAARVVSIEPLSARAHAILGTIVLATGDFNLSVEEFRTALSLKEDEPLAIAGLAMVDFYENRLSASFAGLRRAAFLDSSEPDFTFNLAQAAARSERYKDAADAYERFLQIAPRTDEDRRARIRGLIDFLRYLGAQSNLYDTSGSDRVVVPFELVDDRPVIKVRVSGAKEPLRFVLDTGSGMCVISEATAKRLNLKSVARGGNARAIGGLGRFEIVYGFVPFIDVGDAHVTNVPVYIRRFFDENPVDGYIGLSLINKYVTTVDYGTRTFTLVRQRTLSEADVPVSTVPGVEIPIRTTSSGFLSGEVKLEGVSRPLNFIIDTGATISVVSRRLMDTEELGRFSQTSRMKVYGAAGVEENVTTLMLPRLLLGSHTREKLGAAVLDLDPINETTGFVQSGIIGGNFLRNFRISFDFKRAIVRFEPLKAIVPDGGGPTRMGGAE
ncbi:MAG TPA: aspartyl protease family protein [Pyrinomonadaceae bacterium]